MLLNLAAITAIVGLSVSYFSFYLINQAKMSQDFQGAIDEDIVLNSIIDYTATAIQQRWCFSKTWLRDSKCDLSHPRNVERLLLNSKSLQAISDMRSRGVPIKVSAPVDLSYIEGVISLKDMTSSHPLHTIVEHLERGKIDSIAIEIQRVENDVIFSKGSEVYVSIKASLIRPLGGAITSRLKSMSLIVPRELSSFALVVANDLHLGKSIGPQQGDSAIPTGSESDAGLIFDSPVFVNGSVHLPTGGYSPVTFTENLFLGNGILRKSNLPYVPDSNGGQDERFYSDIQGLGGFKRGVTLTGNRDIGLDYLSGRLVGEPPGSDLMEKCIKMSLASSDLFMTSRSSLLGREISSNSWKGEHKVHLGLSLWNRFTEQKSVKVDITKEEGTFWVKPTLSAKNSKSIARVQIKIGSSHWVEADLHKNTQLSFQPRFTQVDNAVRKVNETKDKISNLERTIWDLQQEIKSLEGSIDDKKRHLREAKERLEHEFHKKEKDQDKDLIESLKDKISDLEREISSLESKIWSERKEIDAKKWELSQAKRDLDTYNRALEEERNPPQIDLVLKDKMMGGFPQFNQATFDIQFTNQKTFDDQDIRISLLAYDVGTEKGDDVRDYDDPKEPTGFKGYSRGITLDFNRWSDQFNLKTHLHKDRWIAPNSTEPIEDPVDTAFNYGELEVRCSDPASGFSFESVNWDISFSEQTVHSWTFADPFDGTWYITRLEAGDKPSFKVRSIVNRCIVMPDATFVAGFLNCKSFTIAPRSKPLKIVGTVVTNRLSIDPSALRAGIWWSNIYHPQAVLELQKVGILKPLKGGECVTLPDPIWHPNPSIVNLSNHYRCHPISLREKANPFTWTSVDPDCGMIDEAASRTSCKFRPKNFVLKELGRGSQ
ncbi:MAG: hypothetical protein KDD33_02135 [Bdellovibrionales bacterium]|nr:hypothetical protein [Bdellovibrionales bacterium]